MQYVTLRCVQENSQYNQAPTMSETLYLTFITYSEEGKQSMISKFQDYRREKTQLSVTVSAQVFKKFIKLGTIDKLYQDR
jgi:hypothetical protein